jgi:hypothetical protein
MASSERETPEGIANGSYCTSCIIMLDAGSSEASTVAACRAIPVFVEAGDLLRRCRTFLVLVSAAGEAVAAIPSADDVLGLADAGFDGRLVRLGKSKKLYRNAR